MNSLIAHITLYHVMHMGESAGAGELSTSFAEYFQTRRSRFHQLVDLAIELDYSSQVPLDKALAVRRECADLKLPSWVLQGLVVQRLRLLGATGPEKQRVCSKLQISYEDVRRKQLLQDLGMGE